MGRYQRSQREEGRSNRYRCIGGATDTRSRKESGESDGISANSNLLPAEARLPDTDVGWKASTFPAGGAIGDPDREPGVRGNHFPNRRSLSYGDTVRRCHGERRKAVHAARGP